MLSTILAVAEAASDHTKDIPLTWNEALSGISGSVSLTCWIFLLIPQVIENYKNQSAEAISLAFVIVWFLGDLCNLLGAAWAGLVPTIIAIAVYFCFSDGVLIGQVLYYGIRNKRREGRSLLESVKDTMSETDAGPRRVSEDPIERVDTNPENEPLLSRKHSRSSSYGLLPGSADPKMVRQEIERRRSSAGSHTAAEIRARRKSSSAAARSAQQEPLAKIFEEQSNSSSSSSTSSRTLKNATSILGIVLIGSLGWLVAYKTGTWKPTPPPTSQPDLVSPADSDSNPAGAQFLGYASAVLYLTARLPQIWKNYREQSCEGLSLLFFILSLMGNGTYGAGILFHSLEKNYVQKNVPWLIGSLGTMFEDIIVFWQFRLYRNNVDEQAVFDDEPEPAGTAADDQAGGSNSAIA